MWTVVEATAVDVSAHELSSSINVREWGIVIETCPDETIKNQPIYEMPKVKR